MQIFWLLVVYPTSITLWKFDFLLIDVVVWNLSISTRSFLIFALHLLFSFQGSASVLLSEQISEEVFLLLKSALKMVGPSGLEPPTSRLSGVRSNRLSYGPIPWWRWGESNPWPPACKAGALPAELHPHLRLLAFLPFQDAVPGTFKIEQCNCVCSHWAFLKAELEIWASHVSMLLGSP